MDPITAVGLISGAFQIGQVITETLAGLSSLRAKFQHADLTIGTLEQQLRTIKAAITQLEEWTRARLRESPAEYNTSLDVALDGCRTVMEALLDQVQALTQGASSNETGIGFRARMRVVWREDIMRGHQERLHSQVIALQLLLLRKAESRRIIWKVADDAATLRSSTRYAGSRANTASSLSQRESMTVDTAVFDFDRTLATTLPYQRVPQRSYSRPDTRSATSHGDQSQMTDEGYASSLVLPGHPSGTISPSIGHRNSVAVCSTAQSPTANHTRRLGSKPSIKSASSPQGPMRGLTDGSVYTRRRPHNRDNNTSIDLTSTNGASAPLIVKTAQTGSCFDVESLIERGRTALLVAAHCGNEAVVDTLIRKNAPLHLAASRGHSIDLEARDSRGQTALWVAAERGEIEATHFLLLSKAKVNARAGAQMTALHTAAKQGDDAIVKLLVNGGANLEARDGHYTVMEILLENKRTPLICAAAVASIWCVDDAGMTALHWAAYNGHTEVVEILSSRKGSLATVNVAKRTALHLAAMNSQFAVVELLLRKQALVETRCHSGLTALHYACLANSANIEAKTEEELQRRPVHIAAIQGSMGLLNLLCDKGASLEARDSLGYRALSNLLERGSPVHLSPDTWAREDSPLCLAAIERDWWPYQHAAYHGHPRLLEILLSRTLAGSATDGRNPKLQLEAIGFAPAADLSEERKREVLGLLHQARHQPETLVQGTTQGTGIATSGSIPAYHFSSLATVPEIANRAGPTQELPGTLEQGLPVSRSQTPEQMHRPLNSEERVLPRPISGLSLGQNPQLGSEYSQRESFAWVSTPPRPSLNHPTPIREQVIQPDGLLSRSGDLFGRRSIDTPVSMIEGSAARSNQGPPFHTEGLESRSGNRAQRPNLELESDSESIASFVTASEASTTSLLLVSSRNRKILSNPSGSLTQCPSLSAPVSSSHSTEIPILSSKTLLACLPSSTGTQTSSVPWVKSTGVEITVVSPSTLDDPSKSPKIRFEKNHRTSFLCPSGTSLSPSLRSLSTSPANGNHPHIPKNPPTLPRTSPGRQNKAHNPVAIP
ncbi:hypothetical protein BJX76DRAFT_349497 [Aspergillus varians]